MRRIAGIKGLRTLVLHESPIADASLHHLTALSNLNLLELEQVELSDTAIGRLSALPQNLGVLHLIKPTIRTKDFEAKLRAALPNCPKIVIDVE